MTKKLTSEQYDALVTATARAYSGAWKNDISTHLGQDVPAWADMAEAQQDAMRRCAAVVLEIVLPVYLTMTTEEGTTI